MEESAAAGIDVFRSSTPSTTSRTCGWPSRRSRRAAASPRRPSATPATSPIPARRSTTSSTTSTWPRRLSRAGRTCWAIKDMAGLLNRAPPRCSSTPSAGGGRSAPPAHARHVRQRRRHLHGGHRCGRGGGRWRGQQHGRHDVAAVAVVAGLRAGRGAARSGVSPRDSSCCRLLGAGSRLLRAFESGLKAPRRRRLRARDSGRPVLEPAGSGRGARRGRRLGGREARLRRGQSPVRRHPQGDALVEGGRGHGHLDGEARSSTGRACARRGPATSPSPSR